jgi:hypothetical protein
MSAVELTLRIISHMTGGEHDDREQDGDSQDDYARHDAMRSGFAAFSKRYRR